MAAFVESRTKYRSPSFATQSDQEMPPQKVRASNESPPDKFSQCRLFSFLLLLSASAFLYTAEAAFVRAASGSHIFESQLASLETILAGDDVTVRAAAPDFCSEYYTRSRNFEFLLYPLLTW